MNGAKKFEAAANSVNRGPELRRRRFRIRGRFVLPPQSAIAIVTIPSNDHGQGSGPEPCRDLLRRHVDVRRTNGLMAAARGMRPRALTFTRTTDGWAASAERRVAAGLLHCGKAGMKPALNALASTFEGRLTPTTTNPSPTATTDTPIVGHSRPRVATRSLLVVLGR
ncbi:hypothetical protein ND748_00695 [Frankia sp. AiPs1]|uniref:hypothetical protein n=1 Tax=Frankia sp. AiPs1 TaxID=573493 RepID=UPI0020448418|nr:hypothetical protein [Frankia sp. AiPs1]MCM3920209.1 hypothetical protein [Frankia sp. AiPs1]